MINLKKLLKARNMSIKECSDFYGIPYATLHAIVNNKTNIEDCKLSTMKKVAKFAGVSIEQLDIDKPNFYVFRSNLHHEIKRKGLLEVYNRICIMHLVDAYIKNDYYVEGLYLMSLAEYIENKNKLPHNEDLNDYRNLTLEDELILSDNNDSCIIIEEFKKRNIMEGNLLDAV